jgi:ATP-binding protein involved in chromosome partitioning
MASDQAQLEQAAASVVDPELGLTLGEAGMVRAVRSRRRRVGVLLALPVAAWPSADAIQERVEAAVVAVHGVDDVTVETSPMDDAERAELRRRLRSLMAGTGNGGGAGGESGGREGPSGGAVGDAVEGGHGHGHGHGAVSTPAFLRPGSATRVVAVSSGKGGVGKSSITVNLAVALARQGRSVGVLDADVYGFSVPKMLGVDHDPVILGDLVVPAAARGVRVLSMGFFVPDDQPVIWRGPMLHKAIEQFLSDAFWGTPDFLVVDMPPGTGDVTLSMAGVMPKAEVVVVTTPQPAAQRVAQRSAHAARKLRLSVRGVVENMSWFTGDDGTRYELFGRGGGQSLADDLGVPLLGRIPLVPALREGGDVGVPVMVSDPEGEAGAAFDALAGRLAKLGPARVYRRELSLR